LLPIGPHRGDRGRRLASQKIGLPEVQPMEQGGHGGGGEGGWLQRRGGHRGDAFQLLQTIQNQVSESVTSRQILPC
jgi:hypothetical protein